VRNNNTLIAIGLALPLFLNAQEIITSSGASAFNSSTQVNWIIGEVFTETFSNKTNRVTSGFCQPNLKIILDVKNIKGEVKLFIFPNPATQIVNINYKGQLPADIKVFNIKGEIISNEKINRPSTELNFSGNKKGIYIIEIIEPTGKSNYYRLVKE